MILYPKKMLKALLNTSIFQQANSNYSTFLNPLRSITEELSVQMTHHSCHRQDLLLPTVQYLFDTRVDEEMHKKSLSHTLNVDPTQPGLEPETS